MRPEITVVAANYESPDWAELLIKSIRKFKTMDVEIIVVDNASSPDSLSWLSHQPDVKLIRNYINVGHGAALDQGLIFAAGRFCACLDIDSHFQRRGWDADLIAAYDADPMTRMVGIVGSAIKPAHPPLWMVECEWAVANGAYFTHVPGVTADTAQGAFHRVIDLGFKVELLPKGQPIYEDCTGDEIYVAGRPTIYHQWYGTRFRERTPEPKSELDGLPLLNHLARKTALFRQPLVRSILDEA